MDIAKRVKGEVVIIDIEGEIDYYNSSVLKDVVQGIINTQNNNFIINFEKIIILNFSVFDALISSLSNLKNYKHVVKIINVSDPIKKLIKLKKLKYKFKIYKSEEEALLNLEMV